MSVYNVRLYDYANSQQIRIYKNPIITKELVEKEKKSKKDIDMPEIDEKNIVGDKSKTDTEKERSKKVSTNRTKQAIYEIARANTWNYFITLTFDRNKIDSSNYDLVVDTVRKWFNNIKARKAECLKYIIVPELHKDGMHYHFHGLLADTDGLTFVDSGIVRNGKKVYNMPEFKLGFTTATEVEDTDKAASYISKYVTKELETAIKGKRRYLASRNVARAKVIEYNMTLEEQITMLDSLTDSITHMKQQDVPQAYQRIQYVELSK